MFDFKQLLKVVINEEVADKLDYYASNMVYLKNKFTKEQDAARASQLLNKLINDCDFLEKQGAFSLVQGK